ncbi:MAG: hypothetical protein Q8936_16625 [Bacillota bacterium]|nr:hypothetical protein [Bacillota bacterium]
MPYREKRIYSGKYLEVEIYSITKKERNMKRKKKERESLVKQKNLNDKNAKKHLIRLINTNFSDKDLAVHLTYDNKNLPSSEEEARKDVGNFLRRLKGYRKRRGLPELKYIAVIEYKDQEEGKTIRIHHHIIMDGVLDRDTVESIWKKGRANADRLKADEFGYEAIARYITKDPKGKKRWTQSKNLKQPVIKINDHKYSRRKVYELFKEKGNAREFEDLYPGYIYTHSETPINDITGTAVYIKMRKLE